MQRSYIPYFALEAENEILRDKLSAVRQAIKNTPPQELKETLTSILADRYNGRKRV